MQVSVLIVSYNVRSKLQRCLTSLRRAAGHVLRDIVVVDNASPDASASMVAANFPDVKLIAWANNRGFSAAVNAAAARAEGDAFLLLNPDTELPAGALPRMLAALQQHPQAAAVGFRQVDAAGRFQLAVGPQPSLWSELLRRTVQRRLDAGSALTGWALDRWLRSARPVPWVAGSSLLVGRTAFEEVGGFDERFFLYFEDIDFCLRLAQKGGLVYYDPSVTLLHHRGVSAATAQAAAARAYRQSQVRFWSLHSGPWQHLFMRGYVWARGAG